MQIKRKMFEYGILLMGIACLLVLGFLFLYALEFIINRIINFSPQNFFQLIQIYIQNQNYIELAILFLWGLLFLGIFLILFSLFLQFTSNLFFRSILLKNLPDTFDIEPSKIAIVIPAYEEESTIKQVILDCKKYANHIIVVNDGSTDRTPEILASFSDIHVLTNRTNLGLGKTMKKGIEYAATLDIDVIVTIDADGQYRAEEIPKIASLVLSKKADLVLGSRFAGEIEKMPFGKKIGNRMMSIALSVLLGLKITDGQTGFRGISQDLAQSYRLRGEYTYTQEMIMQARFLKKKIVEVPIFFDKRKSGSSRLIRSPIDYAMRSWLTIIRTLRDFQPIWFFGGLGLISFLLGLFLISITVGSLVVPWALTIQDPFELAFFSTLLILIGIQFVFFGFLADAQRKN